MTRHYTQHPWYIYIYMYIYQVFVFVVPPPLLHAHVLESHRRQSGNHHKRSLPQGCVSYPRHRTPSRTEKRQTTTTTTTTNSAWKPASSKRPWIYLSFFLCLSLSLFSLSRAHTENQILFAQTYVQTWNQNNKRKVLERSMWNAKFHFLAGHSPQKRCCAKDKREMSALIIEKLLSKSIRPVDYQAELSCTKVSRIAPLQLHKQKAAIPVCVKITTNKVHCCIAYASPSCPHYPWCEAGEDKATCVHFSTPLSLAQQYFIVVGTAIQILFLAVGRKNTQRLERTHV